MCRLLEQEKEEHLALKDTWGMANDRFLETQRVQKVEMDKIRKLLTEEQLQLLGDKFSDDKKENIKLLPAPSPATTRRLFNRKTKLGTNKVRKSASSDGRRSLVSLVQRSSPKSQSLPSTPSLILDVSIAICGGL